jgi:hypothetical protein
LGFELMASRLLGRCCYHLSHSTNSFFVMGFFQDGVSQTICPRAGFQPWSSWVAKITVTSHQHQAWDPILTNGRAQWQASVIPPTQRITNGSGVVVVVVGLWPRLAQAYLENN